jgi:transcriptional regulator with XRE-family HTH domain
MELTHVFGKTLNQLRSESGLTQEKLAELAGYDRTYISLIERGLRKPTIQALFKLSKPLGISPHQFIKLVEDQLTSQ